MIEQYDISASSRLESPISYDPETRVLEITFTSGGTYRYFGVPADVVNDLRIAGSPGKFFDSNIKRGGFEYERIA